MRKMMFFRIGGRDVHMPKLIGAFILTAALLMFVASVAGMFDRWDSVTNYNSCINAVDSSLGDYDGQLSRCINTLFDQTGLRLMVGQYQPTMRQTIQLLLEPIAWVMFWIAALLFGWLIYKSGEMVLPIEESVKEYNDPKKRK